MKVKEEVNVDMLISRFIGMSSRGTLLGGITGVSQEDILAQIIGTIIAEAMEEGGQK